MFERKTEGLLFNGNLLLSTIVYHIIFLNLKCHSDVTKFLNNYIFCLQCLTNSIKYTYNHPNNSNYKENEIKSRLDYILYKFNKKNLVSNNKMF